MSSESEGKVVEDKPEVSSELPPAKAANEDKTEDEPEAKKAKIESEIAEEKPPLIPVKKGRGRPKKPESDGKSQVPSGKGRGRPKGSTITSSEEGSSGKGRGRPKGSVNKVQSGKGRGRPKGSTNKPQPVTDSNTAEDRMEEEGKDSDHSSSDEGLETAYSQEANTDAQTPEKKKRGRPKGTSVKIKKNGRGRPRKREMIPGEIRSPGRPPASPDSKLHPLMLILQRSISNQTYQSKAHTENDPASDMLQLKYQQVSDDQFAASDRPIKKRPRKPPPERSVPAGKLRDTPRLSYKDESDSEIDMDFMEFRRKRKFTGDEEADISLEKKCREETEKKEEGSLRKKPRLSYKDESDSDLESGFESDTMPVYKTTPTNQRGRGRPPKSDSEKRGRGRPKLNRASTPKPSDDNTEHKGRGRPKLPDELKKRKPYVPTGLPRGRPKHQSSMDERDEDSSSSENDDKTTETGERRGRGRPKLPDEFKRKKPYVPTGQPRGRKPKNQTSV